MTMDCVKLTRLVVVISRVNVDDRCTARGAGHMAVPRSGGRHACTPVLYCSCADWMDSNKGDKSRRLNRAERASWEQERLIC